MYYYNEAHKPFVFYKCTNCENVEINYRKLN